MQPAILRNPLVVGPCSQESLGIHFFGGGRHAEILSNHVFGGAMHPQILRNPFLVGPDSQNSLRILFWWVQAAMNP